MIGTNYTNNFSSENIKAAKMQQTQQMQKQIDLVLRDGDGQTTQVNNVTSTAPSISNPLHSAQATNKQATVSSGVTGEKVEGKNSNSLLEDIQNSRSKKAEDMEKAFMSVING